MSADTMSEGKGNDEGGPRWMSIICSFSVWISCTLLTSEFSFLVTSATSLGCGASISKFSQEFLCFLLLHVMILFSIF